MFRWEEEVVASGATDQVISPRSDHIVVRERFSGQNIFVYGGQSIGEALSDLWELWVAE